ncbi:MAG: HyaD/HybD family hydrogenase maturation endopeptidase [Mariprofundus sp.]|nr:HyaD/HybD family hydrogenase maturation endopeptidase [Mariprofundus sp.]
MYSEQKVLILGIGNILWADEGFGVRALEAMQQWYEVSENVRFLDGGTQGMYLVQEVRDADILIVFDAIDYALPPATMKIIEGEDVPKFMGVKKVSLHQTGFQEVLALAEMMGDYPEKLLLIGVQPEEIEDYGGSLRPAVRAQIQPAIDQALSYLNGMGIVCKKRHTPLQISGDFCSETLLGIEAYESGRPPELDACRTGDDRILKSEEFVVSDIDTESISDAGMKVDLDHHLEKYR